MLQNITYDQFFPHILPYVPNCPEIQATNAVRNACIEFCKKTNFLQLDMDPITTIANQPTYDIDVPNGYVLGQIDIIWFNGTRIVRKSLADIEKRYGRQWNLIAGTPECYTQLDPDTITFAPIPDQSLPGIVTGRFSVIPERLSSYIDSSLLERYAEEIADGAIARLAATPEQPYTNPSFAMERRKMFLYYIACAIRERRAGLVAAPLQVKLNRLV